MKSFVLIVMLLAAVVPVPAGGKNARCVITQQGKVAFSGACVFDQSKDGSFFIRRHDAKPILPRIIDVSVTIVSAGEAEVRGLTTDGINSRWGRAIRSRKDAACWTGSDFEICAY